MGCVYPADERRFPRSLRIFLTLPTRTQMVAGSVLELVLQKLPTSPCTAQNPSLVYAAGPNAHLIIRKMFILFLFGLHLRSMKE